MKSPAQFPPQPKFINVVNAQSFFLRGGALGALAYLGLGVALVACSSQPTSQTGLSSQSPRPAQSATSPKTVAQIDTSGKSPEELARFVFDHHGCNNCHTLGQGGKLGFTERGKEVGKDFEGCISLLTAMNVIAQVKEENRSLEEKRKAARFEEFGCTACHRVTPGRMGLTEVGSKLASLHLACTDVQKLLSQR
jgi:cytochrome c551/c552